MLWHYFGLLSDLLALMVMIYSYCNYSVGRAPVSMLSADLVSPRTWPFPAVGEAREPRQDVPQIQGAGCPDHKCQVRAVVPEQGNGPPFNKSSMQEQIFYCFGDE
jgi:hypothetical protein